MDREPLRRTPAFDPQLLLASPAIVFALGASLVTLAFGLWARSLAPDPREVPILSAEARPFYLLLVVAAILFGAAVSLLRRRAAPASEPAEWTERYTRPLTIDTSWMLPAVTLLGALLLVARYHRAQDIAAAVLLAGTGVFAAITVRDGIRDNEEPPLSPARLALLVLTGGVGFVALALVFLYKTRTLYSGPVVFIVAALLLIQSQDGLRVLPIRRVAHGLIGASALAQVTWALNEWPPTGWWGGGVLVSILLGYALIGSAALAGMLTRERVWSYAGLAGLLFLVSAVMAAR